MFSLKSDEAELAEKIIEHLDSGSREEGDLVRKSIGTLSDLAGIISSFPSVRDTKMLRGVVRDEHHLLTALCSFASNSHLLHIPTKVVLFRSFLVAKFHCFSLLHKLTMETPVFKSSLRKAILSILHTLMIEEVYFSCLDDPGFSWDTKTQLANDLVALWDSGTDPRGIRDLSALTSLWTARDAAPPSFGTMNGTTELLRISMELENDWREFLVGESTNDETRWALEEFLFGLTYEEIKQVRSRLTNYGIGAVNYD